MDERYIKFNFLINSIDEGRMPKKINKLAITGIVIGTITIGIFGYLIVSLFI